LLQAAQVAQAAGEGVADVLEPSGDLVAKRAGDGRGLVARIAGDGLQLAARGLDVVVEGALGPLGRALELGQRPMQAERLDLPGQLEATEGDDGDDDEGDGAGHDPDEDSDQQVVCHVPAPPVEPPDHSRERRT
jgi:hypothetical protein